MVKWTCPKYIGVCGIAWKLFTLCIYLYKNYITENLLQNFNEQYYNKLYTTNNRCYIFWTWKVGDVCLVETNRVGFIADKGHKYMFVIVNDIKRIKYHLYASCNIICFTPISAFTSGIYMRLEGSGTSLCLYLFLHLFWLLFWPKEMKNRSRNVESTFQWQFRWFYLAEHNM